MAAATAWFGDWVNCKAVNMTHHFMGENVQRAGAAPARTKTHKRLSTTV